MAGTVVLVYGVVPCTVGGGGGLPAFAAGPELFFAGIVQVEPDHGLREGARGSSRGVLSEPVRVAGSQCVVGVLVMASDPGLVVDFGADDAAGYERGLAEPGIAVEGKGPGTVLEFAGTLEHLRGGHAAAGRGAFDGVVFVAGGPVGLAGLCGALQGRNEHSTIAEAGT